jgi:hypothetical protein
MGSDVSSEIVSLIQGLVLILVTAEIFAEPIRGKNKRAVVGEKAGGGK